MTDGERERHGERDDPARDSQTGARGAGALALVPEWALPALAQGEVDVPFTDVPATFNFSPPDGARRFLDLRKIDGLITPTDQFFFIQHYNKPELDAPPTA